MRMVIRERGARALELCQIYKVLITFNNWLRHI
jgi:hypothetical protein